MSKAKDHVWSAAIGVALVIGGFATAAAVTAVLAVGSAACFAGLATVGAALTLMDVAIKSAAQDEFKLGTCLGSAAVTAGTLTLAFNAIFHQPPEQPKKAPLEPTSLRQNFKDSTGRNDKRTLACEIMRDGAIAAFPQIKKPTASI